MTDAITLFRGKHFFLSNFYPEPMVFEGIEYASSEHAYQAQKTTTKRERDMVRKEPHPAGAKKLALFIDKREDWKDVRLDIMRRILRAKFSNPVLRQMLLDTGDAEIIHNNKHKEFFWGVCNEHGLNMLGKLLMELRQEIRDSPEEEW